MINFYPGPSKVYSEVKSWLNQVYDEGILSIQHRSEKFMTIYEDIVKQFQIKHHLPKDYTLIFTSSATECWHILNDNFSSLNSYHFYNGAFGEKWFDYRNANYPNTTFGNSFKIEQELEINSRKAKSTFPSLICLCQNETSNGTQISNQKLYQIRKSNPNDFIFIDATSSWAGQKLDFQNADAWFASVQKCFGLPAGLGVMTLSPRLIDFYQNEINTAKALSKPRRYNQLPFLIEKANQFQTTYTPNVLEIYLLSKVIKSIPPISKVSQKIEERATELYQFFEKNGYNLLIKNPKTRSSTVLTIQMEEKALKVIKEKALQEGITLGNGYGDWKQSTFRVANFPQHTDKDFDVLKEFLKKNK